MALKFLNNGYFAGKVGIGTESPDSTLTVKATVDSRLGGIGWKSNDGTNEWTIDAPNAGNFRIYKGATAIARFDSSGNFGIGTTSPGYKLSVNGNIQSDFIRGYTYPTNSFLDFDDDQTASTNHTRLASIGRIAYLADTNANEPAANAAHEFFTGTSDIDTATSLMIIETSGNVGIGTTSPGAKLDVNGDVYINSNYPSNAAASDLTIGKTTTGDHGLTIVTGASNTAGIFFADNNNNDAGRIKYQHSSNSMRFDTNRSEAMRITSTGNVGIGTTSPNAKLHVNGQGRFGAGAGFTQASSVASLITARSYTYGQYSPQLNGSLVVANTNTEGTAGFISLAAYYGNTNNTIYSAAGIGGGKETTVGDGGWGGYLSFFTTSDGTAGAASGAFEHMRITADGNVGIGTTSPSEALNIGNNGNIRFDNNGSGKGIIASSNGSNNTFSLTRQDSVNTGDFSISGYSGVGLTGGRTSSPATSGYHLYVASNGNVGIGDTTPSEKLDVAGNIKIQSALLSNQENTDVDTGTETVAEVSTAAFTAAFFDFVIKKTTNVRSGTVYACHDGAGTPLIAFTETSTQDLGNTSDVTLSVDISGGNMRLLATVTSDDWIIKSLIRAI